MVLLFSGAVARDIILTAPTYPSPDSKSRLTSLSTTLGGNAFTNSIVASRLAAQFAPSLLVSLAASVPATGRDVDDLRDALSSVGCAPLLVPSPGVHSLPTSYVLLAADAPDTRTVMHFRGDLPELALVPLLAASRHNSLPSLLRERGVRWVHAEGRSVAFTHSLLSSARECGVGTSLELEKQRPDGDVLSLLSLADLVVCSAAFATTTVLPGAAPGWQAGAVQKIAALGGPGVVVVVTDGGNGAWVGGVDGVTTHVPAAPLTNPVVDTLGAGDTFVGALCLAAACRTGGLPLPLGWAVRAVQWAAAVAAKKVQRVGPLTEEDCAAVGAPPSAGATT